MKAVEEYFRIAKQKNIMITWWIKFSWKKIILIRLWNKTSWEDYLKKEEE